MRRGLPAALIAAVLLLASAAQAAADPESDLFAEAERYFRAGSYLLAVESTGNFVRRYPLSDRAADAQYLRAVSLYQLGRYSEALSAFDTVENRYRSTRYSDSLYFWKGLTLYRLRDYQKAVQALDRYLAAPRSQQDPELAAQGLLTRAQAEIALRNFRAASRDLEALRRDHPASPFARSGLALLAYSYLQEGRTAELLVLAEAVEGELGRLPEGQRNLLLLYTAEAMWEEGRQADAEALYSDLLEAREEVSSVAFRRLFLAAESAGDLGRMQSLIARAENQFAGSPQALRDLWVQVGAASYQQARWDLAEYFFEKVLTLGGRGPAGEHSDATAPLYLAEIRIRRGELDQAAQVLEDYLSREPGARESREQEMALMRLADVRLLQRAYPEAAGGYARFMERYPDSPRYVEAGTMLTYVRYRQGDLNAARDLGRRLLRDARTQPVRGDSGPGEAGGRGPAPEDSSRPVSFRQDLYRLLVAIEKRQGNRREAVALLREYVSYSPRDLGARSDLLKQLFLLQDYSAVTAEARRLEEELPDLEARSVYAAVLARYLRGLAEIARKNYAPAARSLAGISGEQARAAGLEQIEPYALYYQAWALYRQGSYREALGQLARLLEGWPAHQLFPQGLFLAGWCSFSLRDYAGAAGYFARLAKMNTDLATKAAFLQGRSLVNLQDFDEAAAVFRTLYTTQPASPFADDALFEYAGILAERGRWSEAASTYAGLAERYPASPLAEEALYKRAEVLGAAGQNQQAKEAYFEYRRRFPKGRLVDASLYWGGIAAYELGEKFEAVLHWERLAQEYPESPFVVDALRRTAEAYADRGDYRRAIQLYTTLRERFPDEAQSYGVGRRLDELRYQLQGLSDREALLSSIVGREGGARTQKGREAMIELSRMYIYEGSGRIDLAYQMLESVVEKQEPETAAQAQYLIGEYHYRKGDTVRAAQEFLKAAYTNPGDRDLMAASIYRAAEMMSLAGRRADVRELTGRLEQHFPDSPWTVEARKLTEGGSR